ncbi:BTAD domain-containing putative transcriptional regulator [Dactylosporangium sp. AC04546]|uniref:ATP-binding protein n=1 Tax=Dactylosporangium sp. AC04546 TaxID=2862460 RepID=UPI001EDD2458|nr:AfsR/SARP family transcriptional regulator [Dactylosporangium sp. AC04546]WVK82752.1 BTAD domain-containing putative transcriptional regulator [Dactylosporangium sp. AC04546]
MLMRVLGPFEVDVDSGGAVDLGGPRQRAVLALLLSARGDVVSVDRMIEDLWRGEAPPRAIASLQAYVSNLRRMLEPARERRAPARLLVSAPPGYAIRLPADAVDAWRFEQLLTEARAVHATEPGRARLLLRAGLGLWRGNAYGEFAEETWAQAEAARLEELRLVARELLLDAGLRTGGAAEVVAEAEVLTRQAPLREENWRLLALALWSTGRQADALAALRRARTILADELGLDPGPALLDVEQAILTQRTEVLPQVAENPVKPVNPAQTEETPPEELFVGRDAELASLRAAAAERPRIALVTGEAGVGKSSLLARFRHELADGGWLVLTGRCPEVEGAPPAWAWVEALRRLATEVPPGELAPALAPLLDDADGVPDADVAAGRFRLHRAVVAWLRQAAARRPVAVVLDDLHAADAETLLLLTSVAEMPELFLVAALRPADNRERLAETMAALARRSPHRVHLDGLGTADVERLVGAFARTAVDAETVAALTERTGGNPFYLRESAQLLASEGALVATSEVPEGVRDVLRRRLSRLPQPAVAVLRLAAVVGREADVETLVEAADADEGAVLDALEAGLIAGLLTEPAPGRVRFVHGLVRDTMYTDLSQLRRARMHARVAESARRLRPDDYPALAHHYARAASTQTAPLAVDYAVRAAELAERRYAYDAAIELLTTAVGAAGSDAVRVDLLGRLLRAQARAGAIGAARETRARAVDVAVASGSDELLVAALTAWKVATPWQIRPYGEIDARIVELLSRVLRRAELTPEDRCRLLEALVNELDGEADPRGPVAGREALELSRGLADPQLRALGLAAQARSMPFDREPEVRGSLGRELRDLAEEHGLVSYQWLAEQIIGNCAAAANRPAEMRASVERQREIARTYQLNEAFAISISAQAALAHIVGDFAIARRLYDESYDLMRRQGSLHADGFHFLATSTLLLTQGRFAEQLEPTRYVRQTLGPIADDALALALAAAGRLDEARRIPVGRYPIRPDYFESAFYTIRALAVVALGRADLAPAVIEALSPVRDQLAGYSSASVVLRPVALTLADLYRLLGRDDEAAEHLTLAVEVAQRWDSPHWAAEARAA